MSYKISGFSDEIDKNIDKQFAHLNALGITYFEARGINETNISDLTDEQLLMLREKMNEYGISVSSIGSPIGKINITDEFEPHLEKLKRTIHIAKALNSAYIRIFSFYIPDEKYDLHRSEVMRRMTEMVKLAEKSGIILLHENEKGIYGDNAERCADIFSTVKSPALRAVFDPANFVQCGQSVYPDAYELLKDNIEYMHIKDALPDGSVVPAGFGNGCVSQVINSLLDSGYNGFFSLEPHLGAFSGLENLEVTGEMLKLSKSTPDKFTLAYNSLMDILKRRDK